MSRRYEFSYTTTATGIVTTFTLSDASGESATDSTSTAISEEVARAIRGGLKRVTALSDIVVTRVSDTQVVDRTAMTPDP